MATADRTNNAEDEALRQSAASLDEATSGSAPAPFYKRVSEVIRDPSEWADLPQIDIDALEGAEVVIHDVMFLRGNIGERADMDYAIILFAGPNVAPPSSFPRDSWKAHDIQTSMCGGAVFVRKMKQLTGYGVDYAGEPNQLPMLGRVIKRLGTRYPTPYYDFV